MRGPEFNPKRPPILKQAVWDLALVSLGTNKEGHLEQAWDPEPSVLGTAKSLGLLDQGVTQTQTGLSRWDWAQGAVVSRSPPNSKEPPAGAPPDVSYFYSLST